MNRVIVSWRWVNRAEPPPAGVIVFETAVPSLSSTDLTPETYCNPSIPGWYVSGETEMSVTELVAWYSDRFGPGQRSGHRVHQRGDQVAGSGLQQHA